MKKTCITLILLLFAGMLAANNHHRRINDDSEYLIVVFWTNMLPKISKSAIETVKANLRKNDALNKATIVLVNTDKFYEKLK